MSLTGFFPTISLHTPDPFSDFPISSFPSSSVAVQLFLDAPKASTYSCITFSVSVVSNSEAWNIAGAVERYIGTGLSSPFGQNSPTNPKPNKPSHPLKFSICVQETSLFIPNQSPSPTIVCPNSLKSFHIRSSSEFTEPSSKFHQSCLETLIPPSKLPLFTSSNLVDTHTLAGPPTAWAAASVQET